MVALPRRIPRLTPRFRMALSLLITGSFFLPTLGLLTAEGAAPTSDSLTDLDLNFGVFDQLSAAQARKAQKTDPAPIIAATSALEPRLTPRAIPRVAPVAPYTIQNTTQAIPDSSSVFDVVESSPLPPLSTVLQFFLQSGPLGYLIHTNCSGTSAWTPGYLRPTFQLNVSVFPPTFLDTQLWQPIDCDADPGTGVNSENVTGADIRVRLVPTITNITTGFSPGPGPGGGPSLNPHVDFVGGVSIEVERLGPAAPLPLNLSVLKSFSYDQNNYVWFVNFDFPDTPRVFNNSFTSDEVSLGGNLTELIANIVGGITGNLPLNTYIAELRGPYRLGWNFTGDLPTLALSAGYARFTNVSGQAVLRERTWFDVGLEPASGQTAVPSVVRLRLDSASFNQSFDYLEWTADRPALLNVHYFDDRENFTYARATIRDLPTFLQANVDQVGTGDAATARIRYQANAEVKVIDYDEYIFLNRDPTNFIYSHVRLEDLPRELIVNGTLDIGGSTFEPQFLPRAGVSLIGEIIDRIMIRISSKLYSVGQTLRAIPNNILNLPNDKGWVSIDLPAGGEIGLLEFWLSSGKWAVAPGDFVAFYNDSTLGAPPGAVATAFAGRLQHIEKLLGGFIEETQLTLVTSESQPLSILFLDAPAEATAVAEIHDLPHEFSLRISPTSMRYAASSSVSWLAYTSTIGPAPGQYTRIYLEDVPAYLSFNQTPGDVRVDTLLNAPGGPAGIGLFELHASNREPLELAGDHLLSFENGTVSSASVRIHDIASLRYVQGAGGKVRFTAKGGDPFSIVFLNRTDPLNRLETFLNFDPLPSTLDVTLPGSLQSVNPISLPSLGSLTSVVDFSHIIFAIDSFGRSVASMLAQVGANLANGIGNFDQNFSFAFDSNADTTITANISKGNWAPRDEAQWVHGLRSKQRVSPTNNTSLDLNAKLYLTGLPHHMDFTLNVEAQVLSVNATLLDFTPKFDYLAIETDAASVDPNDQPKNIRFFTDGILPHTDIALKVDFLSDLSIGGSVVGNMAVNSTYPLKDFYVRLTTNHPRPTAVEVLMPSIPEYMNTRAEMADGISITHRAIVPVDFVFVRMSRGIVSAEAAAYAVFHDVPPQADIRVPAGGAFDMSSPNPFKTLPNITMVANQPGLDLLADLRGEALGTRGSLRFLALDLGTRLTMTQSSGSSYSIASDGVQRLLLDLTGFPISKGLTIDAASIYAENISSATISNQLIFNSLPILTVDNLNAEKLQIKFEHRINALSGAAKPTTFVFVTVPLGSPGPVSVASNGIVTSRENAGRYLIVPAPALSWILSQF
jgi:hypothetical protein